MKFFAIDASTEFLHIGVFDGNDVRYASYQNTEQCLLENLRSVPNLRQSLVSMDFLAVGLGPGSFNGLRYSVAAMQAIAISYQKPLLGFSSIDALVVSLADPDVYIAQYAFNDAVDVYHYQNYLCLSKTRVDLAELTSYMLQNNIKSLYGDVRMVSLGYQPVSFRMNKIHNFLIGVFFSSLPKPMYS